MFTFLMISDDKRFCDDIVSAMQNLGCLKKQSADGFIVEDNKSSEKGWIAMQPLNSVISDYEEEELAFVRNIIHDPMFYMIEGRDGDICFSNEIILNMNCEYPVLIDNDHGLIVNILNIKKMISDGKQWLYFPMYE